MTVYMDCEEENAMAEFNGSIIVRNNILENLTSDLLYPIFIGYEESTEL